MAKKFEMNDVNITSVNSMKGGKGKRTIEYHFDSFFELEQLLNGKGKYDLLEEVQSYDVGEKLDFIKTTIDFALQ